MKTLQLSEQKARELYRSGSKELKTVLEESFGEDFFFTRRYRKSENLP